MATLLELEVPMEKLELGQATGSFPDSHIELEQIVPLDDGIIPYFWATVPDDEGFEAFEASVRADDAVDRLELVAAVADRRLYRVHWRRRGGFVRALSESEATVLEGHGSDPWTFRLLFPTRSNVTTFREACSKEGIPFDVVRVSELQDGVTDPSFGLTKEQHEALRLAVEHGYYSIPRNVAISDLAAEVGISQQAMSERLRRGTAKVLTSVIDTDPEHSD